LVRFGRNRSQRRRVFLKRVVDSVREIIRDVIPHQTAPINVIEDNYVIEKLSATTSDPAFRDSILPRACGASAHGFHAVRCQHVGHLLAKLAVPQLRGHRIVEVHEYPNRRLPGNSSHKANWHGMRPRGSEAIAAVRRSRTGRRLAMSHQG
jgi:hypothetical protein